MQSFIPNHKGFIQIILIIVIALIVLGYFSINIADVMASPVVKENLAYVWNLVKDVWGTYLSGPAAWVWEHIVRVLWDLFLEGVGNLENNNAQIPVEQIPAQ